MGINQLTITIQTLFKIPAMLHRQPSHHQSLHHPLHPPNPIHLPPPLNNQTLHRPQPPRQRLLTRRTKPIRLLLRNDLHTKPLAPTNRVNLHRADDVTQGQYQLR